LQQFRAFSLLWFSLVVTATAAVHCATTTGLAESQVKVAKSKEEMSVGKSHRVDYYKTGSTKVDVRFLQLPDAKKVAFCHLVPPDLDLF
jgi:hypothetical protein